MRRGRAVEQPQNRPPIQPRPHRAVPTTGATAEHSRPDTEDSRADRRGADVPGSRFSVGVPCRTTCRSRCCVGSERGATVSNGTPEAITSWMSDFRADTAAKRVARGSPESEGQSHFVLPRDRRLDLVARFAGTVRMLRAGAAVDQFSSISRTLIAVDLRSTSTCTTSGASTFTGRPRARAPASPGSRAWRTAGRPRRARVSPRA